MVLIIVALIVKFPLFLPVLPAAVLVLSLLSSPLLLGVVDLVDVFVSLDQINREFPQRSSAGLSVARLDAAPRQGHQVASVRPGAGVLEAHHLGEQVVGLPSQGGDHRVVVL